MSVQFCCFCLRSFSECMSQRNLKHPGTCNHQIKWYTVLPTPATLPDPPDLSPAPLPACLPVCPCSAGKELALAARQEEELRLKRMVEQRQVRRAARCRCGDVLEA